MFDLKLTSSEISGSTCAVSWCVDEETLKYLGDNNIVDPQVVIVVAPEGRRYHSSREYRKVVPMKDLIAYVEFRVGGPNKIWGFITHQIKSHARDMYLSRRDGDFKTNILNADGSEYTYDLKQDYSSSNQLLISTPQPVVIPTDVFAAEPPEWEKTWVNHFFREKPIDQCDFRRRRMFAYGVQPIIMLGNILVRFFFFTVGLLIGARDLSLQPLLHPLSYNLSESTEVCCGGTIFIRHCWEDDAPNWSPRPLQLVWYMIRSFYLLPFMPPFLALTILMIVFHVWKYFIVVGIIVGLISIVGIVIAFLSNHMYVDVFNWVASLFETKSKGNGSNDTPWYMDQEEIDLLTCKPDRKAFDFKSLPARKKTLHLRYQDLKAKICKPFSA